jgi:hypothetical protein
MTPPTSAKRTSSSHKRKRLKQEDVVFGPSPRGLPLVSQSQVTFTPPAVLVGATNLTTGEPSPSRALVSGSQPSLVNNNNNNNDNLLNNNNDGDDNAPIPTDLALQFNVHPPTSLSIRDEHSRGRFIQFGFEQPPFKKTRVGAIFTPVKTVATSDGKSPLQQRKTQSLFTLQEPEVTTSPGDSLQSDSDSSFDPNHEEEIDLLAKDLLAEADDEWFFDPPMSNSGQINVVQYNEDPEKLVSVLPGDFIIDLRRFPLAFNNTPATDAHDTLILVSTEAVELLDKDRTKSGCTFVNKQVKNGTKGEVRAPKVSKENKELTKQNKNQVRTRKSYSKTTVKPTTTLTPDECLPVVYSFGYRTLILEDLMHLEPNRSVSIFFRNHGLPPFYLNKITECHELTQQDHHLPVVQYAGNKFYFQLHGRVIKNMVIKDWLDKQSLKKINETIQFSEESKNCLVIRCPGYGVNGIDYDLKLMFNELFLFPQSIFVQADIPFKFDITTQFRNLVANPRAQKALFHRLLQEFNVDRWMVQLLVTSWKTVVEKKIAQLNTKHNCEFEADVAHATGYNEGVKDSIHQPLLRQPGVKAFCQRIDKLCEMRISQTFGRFSNPNDNILGSSEMRQITTYMQTRIPNIHEQYMGRFGYRNKIDSEKKETRKPFLEFRYSLLVLLWFIMDVRKSNNRWLVYFGVVVAAAQYAAGHSDLALNIPTFIGFATSRGTMQRRLSSYLLDYMDNLKDELSGYTLFVAVFDNIQKGKSLKFQYGGSCCSFLKATMRFFVKPYLGRLPEWLDRHECHPKMTFFDQAIPSPFEMPAFETLDRTSFLKMVETKQFPQPPVSDPFSVNGTRMDAYFNFVTDCYDLRQIYKTQSVNRSDPSSDYAFQPRAHANNSILKIIKHNMKEARMQTRKDGQTIFAFAKNFQALTVKTWKGSPPACEILPMPISIQDETKKEGTAMILYEFLEAAGMLVFDDDRKKFKLGQNWNRKWLLLVGDELSIRRSFEFMDDVFSVLDRSKFTFKGAYIQAMLMKKLLPRIVPISGDLHLRFHQLDTTFRLAYGGFLQPIQWKLGWKKVCGTNVPDSYQNCHELAMLTYEEADRIMRDVHTIKFIANISFRSLDWISILHDKEKLALRLAQTYESFLVGCVRNSKDWVRRYICNYLLIMRKYCLFKEAERSGDSPLQDYITSKFFPYYQMLGKTNSKNTLIKVMELHYRLPPQVLHHVRMNRTRKQRDVFDSDGRESPNKGLDELMERLMPFMKKFSHNGTYLSWVRISKLLLFCLQALCFVGFYTRLRLDAEHELNERRKEVQDEEATKRTANMADPTGKRKRTVKPTKRNVTNRMLVTEILLRADIHNEKNTRTVVDEDHFWKALDLVEQEVKGLAKPKVDPKSKLNAILQDKNVEKVVSTILGASENNNAKKTKNGKKNDDNDFEIVDREERSVFDDDAGEDDSLNGADVDEMVGLESGTGDVINDQIEEVTPTTGFPVVEINIAQPIAGSKSKETIAQPIAESKSKESAKIEFVKMNLKCTRNVYEEGKEMMKNMKLSEEREQALLRKKREDYFLIEKLFDRLSNIENGSIGIIDMKPKSNKAQPMDFQLAFQNYKQENTVT